MESVKKSNVFRPWTIEDKTVKIQVKKEPNNTLNDNHIQSENIIRNIESLIPKQEEIDVVNIDDDNDRKEYFTANNLDSFSIAYRGLDNRSESLPESLSSAKSQLLAAEKWLLPQIQMQQLCQPYASFYDGLSVKKIRPKKFKCEECGAAFSNNGQLKGHIRIHTGERPFSCDFQGCRKRFTRNEELTRHKRIHTGVKPFYCPINGCNKSFGRKDHLKKHIKTHEREYIHPGGHAGMSTMLPPTSLSLTAAAAVYNSPPLVNNCSYTAPPNSAAFLINSVSRLPRFLS